MRLTGGALVLLCGLLWTGDRDLAGRTQVERVAAWADLFAGMGEQIDALCLPIGDILAAMPTDLLAACGLPSVCLPEQLIPAAGEVRDRAAGEAIARALSELGRGSREDQVRLCRTAAGTLRDHAKRLAEREAGDRRVRRTLTVCGCLGLVILLW